MAAILHGSIRDLHSTRHFNAPPILLFDNHSALEIHCIFKCLLLTCISLIWFLNFKS